MNQILNNQIPQLVAFITSEMTNREDKKAKWAAFKNLHNDKLCEILGVDSKWGLKAGSLIGFDLDEDRKLILLNYSASAHNLLHEIEDGWSLMLRQMRGLVYSWETPGQTAGIRLISRGFEKFFNQSEIPETSIDSLTEIAGSQLLACTAKEDGHMIEYFMHDRKLCSTTRGRLGTPSADAALDMIARSTFMKTQIIAKRFGKDLMSLVCEFVHPMTRVHVDYGDAKKLFLLEAYDTAGEMVGRPVLEAIADELYDHFVLPDFREMTLTQLVAEINNRDVHNREGWVAFIPESAGGFRRVKFKYIAYIGEMVKSKLSYKYLMNCIKNDRLDKMLITLPEEIRAVAYDMVTEVVETTNAGANSELGYKSLYSLYSPNEGGVDYFRTVCRGYYREVASLGSKRVHINLGTTPRHVDIKVSA